MKPVRDTKIERKNITCAEMIGLESTFGIDERLFEGDYEVNCEDAVVVELCDHGKEDQILVDAANESLLLGWSK